MLSKFSYLKNLIVVLVFINACLLLPGKISAATNNVFISEFLPDATGADSGKEWIELYNNSNQPQDLSNYKIKTTSHSSGAVRQSVLPSGTIIQANSFLIVSESISLFPGSIDLGPGGLNMYNSDAQISLEDSSGNILFAIDYSTSISGKSWEVPGPFLENENCNSNLNIHPSSDSRGSANSNEDINCWEVNFEIINILFSVDEENWSTTLESTSENNLFLAYEISEDAAIEYEEWQLDDGTIISSPVNLSDYQNRSIKLILQVNGIIYEKWSNPINIIPEIEEIFLEKIEFSIDNINWSESIFSQDNVNLQMRFNFNKPIDIFESVKWFDFENNEIQNPFTTSNYYDKTIRLQVIYDEIEYSFESEPLFILKPEEIEYTLQITEIYPSPETNEYEWIEIYNYGDKALNLKDSYFKDKGTGSNEYGSKSLSLNDININPGEYFVIQVPSSSITLNNSGDIITLFNSQGIIIDKVSYSSTPKSTSQNRRWENNKYLPEYSQEQLDIPLLINSELVTQGTQNQFPSIGSPSLELINIIQAKSLGKGSEIYIEGIVSVALGILDSEIFYIQDETGGIKIDLPAGMYFDTYEGQRLRIKGILSESNNELKVNIKTLDDIESQDSDGNQLGQSEVYFEQAINDFESLEGQMVHLEGEIIENYSTSFDIETPFGIIRISIDSDTGIELSDKSIGDSVVVFGVFNQYNDSYRIQPRYQSDILIINKPKTTTTKKQTSTSSVKKATKSSILKPSKSTPTNQNSLQKPELSVQGINITKNLINSPESRKTVIYLWPVYTLGLTISILGVYAMTLNKDKRLEFRDRVEKIFGI